MKQSKAIKYLFIINSGSGTNPATHWEEQVRAYFDKSGDSYAIFVLPEKIDVKEIENKLAITKPQNLVAVGGDGTITMLAKMVEGTDTALGIIPAGSANGMAKELGIPEDATAAMNVISAGKTRPSDLIKINDHYCLHLSDLGLNAQLVKYFSEGKLRGKLGYARVILKTLYHKQKMLVDIQAAGKQIKQESFMIAFANAKKYGTGAVINPEGKTDDGSFELIIVKKLRFGALLRMLFKPGRFNPKNIEIISCTQAVINTKHPVHFQVDGEYIGKEKKVIAEIRKNVLLLILPDASL